MTNPNINLTVRLFCNALFAHEQAKIEFRGNYPDLVGAMLAEETPEWLAAYENWGRKQREFEYRASHMVTLLTRNKTKALSMWDIPDTFVLNFREVAETTELWNMLPRKLAVITECRIGRFAHLGFYLAGELVAVSRQPTRPLY